MKGYIYLIENKINGKKYIGKTYDKVSTRFSNHMSDSKRYPERPLYRAILKYGRESFTVRELEYVENPEEREIYWINFYDTYSSGYNATLGGDGKTYFPHSDQEVVEKYGELGSIFAVAKFFNANERTISARLNNNGVIIHGNIHSEGRSWTAKKVKQYSLDGEFLNSFESYSEAARKLVEDGITTTQVKHIVTNISKVCRGLENRKQSYGFIWKLEGK